MRHTTHCEYALSLIRKEFLAICLANGFTEGYVKFLVSEGQKNFHFTGLVSGGPTHGFIPVFTGRLHFNEMVGVKVDMIVTAYGAVPVDYTLHLMHPESWTGLESTLCKMLENHIEQYKSPIP